MEKKKKKMYRILDMISLLGSGYKKWRARDLAELYGVTSRTIYRDLDLMQELGIPIYKDEERSTYTILEEFHFKSPEMTREEAVALFLVVQAFEGDINPYHKELNNAISKIINSLPSSVQKILKDIDEKITFQPGTAVDMSEYRKILNILREAVEKYCPVQIKYYSLSSNQIKKRKVNPYRIVMNDGAYYLTGYCHLRQEVRLFRVDRIREISKSKGSYEIPENFDIDEYLHNAWGVERGGQEEKIELIFTGKSARLVREKQWHPTQQIIEKEKNKIRFEVITGSMREIMNWILQYGSEVEVIRPESLRKKVAAEIEKMQGIYKKTDV